MGLLGVLDLAKGGITGSATGTGVETLESERMDAFEDVLVAESGFSAGIMGVETMSSNLRISAAAFTWKVLESR